MTEDQDAKDSQSDSGSKTFVNKSKDKKIKSQRPLTKIIMRRLPPSMTEEAFLEQVSPIPDHDHFYFARPDPSLGNNLYSRAYINFVNVDDIYLFRDKFDGYIFVDEKGVEYVGIVEYAPFQRIPKKKKKKDPKCNTIESDPVYKDFLENLTKDPEQENIPKLEFSYPIPDSNDKKMQSTPLLEYLAARKQDKRGRDERRRRENDKRKMRIERKTKDGSIKEEEFGENEVKVIKSRDWEKEEQKVENKKKKEYSKEDEQVEDSKKDKRDKLKESPREQKSKKYSDTRKDRLKTDSVKSDKPSVISKLASLDGKKSLNHDDIKPFTQLPQVKTDDLTKMIESLDRNKKLEELQEEFKSQNDEVKKDRVLSASKIRRNSLDSGESPVKEECVLKRQKSLDDRGKSTDREGSEEKEKSESSERRAERRIRNKDRPSLVIYQPGMGKFSKQRLAKEKDVPATAAKSVTDCEKRDT